MANNDSNSNSSNGVSEYSSLIIMNEKTGECMMMSNENKKKDYTVIPHKFYGFPSIPFNLNTNMVQYDKHADGINSLNNTYQQFMVNQLPLESMQHALPPVKDTFYLGSLVTPFYIDQINRHLHHYFLLLVDSNNSPASESLNKIIKQDDLESQLQWISAVELVQEFEQSSKLLTPETLYMLRLLKMFKNRDQLGKLVKPDDDQNIGITKPLEYAPFIESIPVRSNTLMPFCSTNLIVSQSNGYVMVVDPGSNHHGAPHFENIIQKKLKPYLNQQEGGKQLYIFITHNHHDHWHGLPMLERHFPQATLVAHPITLENIPTSLKTRPVLGKPLNAKVLNNTSDNNNQLVIGDRVFEIISTPGHTADSLCLFEPTTKTLIAGDHIVGWGSSILDPHGGGDMKEYLDNTQGMIDHLKPSIAMPAHGPTHYEPIALLSNYISHRLAREHDILSAYQQGNKTLNQLLNVVYKGIDPKLNELAKGNIHLHLEKLKKDNKL
ncbi:hypothetical protein CYY_003000 [Polysphondylium violaceum]|uniref:Metallo-beta-lactamase domain-containing protein n=1 Tax=Polysphondylium violaceum TaxID=133409 RepID=A0A8J4Q0D2_9MYCE|nr:hypothetical protein CYY_003000 [Polysphondylium violaceum]